MHSTAAFGPVATTSTTCVSVAELSYRLIIQTPQRKANYKDRNRPRRKDLKKEAFLKYSCTATSDIKKYLKVLGIKLDLRLTAAWKAIVRELESQIKAAKAIVDALQTAHIKVGDRVIWDYPMGWGYIEVHFPLIVMKVEGDMAYLDILDRPVPVSQLQLVA
jgi:hypothetical protein